MVGYDFITVLSRKNGQVIIYWLVGAAQDPRRLDTENLISIAQEFVNLDATFLCYAMGIAIQIWCCRWQMSQTLPLNTETMIL